MKRFFYVSAVLAVSGAALVFYQPRAEGQTPAGPAKSKATAKAAAKAAPDPHGAMINQYCFGCHNSRIKVGGLALDALNLKTVQNDAATWEKAMKKLRGHLMPPPGSPQPPQADIDQFVSWMEASLDAQPKGPKAGYVPVQRLNRTEYATAVKALIGVEVNEKDVLPQDIQVDGFDNIAESLTTSPAFLDQYITAARHMAKAGVGNMAPPIASFVYQPDDYQDPALPMPPGLRGAMKFTHSVPADGEYRFNILDFDLDSVPAARRRRLTVTHGLSSTAGARSIEQQL